MDHSGFGYSDQEQRAVRPLQAWPHPGGDVVHVDLRFSCQAAVESSCTIKHGINVHNFGQY